MSIHDATARGSRRRKLFAWVVVGVAVVAVLAVIPRLRRPQAPAQSAAAAFPVSVETLKTGAGKVGDLLVTQESMELAEIRVAPADLRVVADKLQVSGVVEAGGDREIKVTPRVAGRIISVSAVVGDTVRAGQTLATMESVELARAQAAYRRATSRLALARDNLKRQRELAKLGVFAKPQVEDARKDVAALQEHTGKPTVYVANEGTAGAFEVRHVTLGVSGDGWREVTAGLEAGERVAVSGTFYLKSEAMKDALSDGCCAAPGGE